MEMLKIADPVYQHRQVRPKSWLFKELSKFSFLAVLIITYLIGVGAVLWLLAQGYR